MARKRKTTPSGGNGPRRKPLRSPQAVRQALERAVRQHGTGRLWQAEALYRQVLEADPTQADALHLLGVVAHQRDDNETAIDLIRKAIEARPGFADAYCNLGNAFHAAGRFDEALESFYQALALAPTLAEAHNNAGNALKEMGRFEDALERYEMATTIEPGYAQAWRNRGSVLQDLGRLDAALESLNQALSVRPDYPEAHNNLGIVLQEMGRIDEAIGSYKQALELRPGYAGAQANLAGVYLSRVGDGDLAVAESYKGLRMLRSEEFGGPAQEAAIARLVHTGLPLFRIRHDVQQADFLAGDGRDVAGIEAFRDGGHGILSRSENQPGRMNEPEPRIRLTQEEAVAMLPYWQAEYLHPMPEVAGDALNPEKDWSRVEEEYLDSRSEIIHIDDFLSDEALASFRQFSLASKVWLKEYPNQYLGAFSEQGFISPLHLQLARELREKMPRVFGPHAIGKFWGFKYDSSLGRGINVHADFAVVNLNFWITPDEHNLDPDSGGLKVYDVPSPDNWRFRAYNSEKEEIYRFLEENGAKSVIIPHRANRAGLFNSDYFHETDEIRFAEGYESRRVNITYLFGERKISPGA